MMIGQPLERRSRYWGHRDRDIFLRWVYGLVKKSIHQPNIPNSYFIIMHHIGKMIGKYWEYWEINSQLEPYSQYFPIVEPPHGVKNKDRTIWLVAPSDTPRGCCCVSTSAAATWSSSPIARGPSWPWWVIGKFPFGHHTSQPVPPGCATSSGDAPWDVRNGRNGSDSVHDQLKRK